LATFDFPSGILHTHGTISRTLYDEQGHVAYATDPFVPGQADVRGSHTIYDAAGRVITSQRVEGLLISVTTDRLGTGTALFQAGGTVLSESDTLYDALGRANSGVRQVIDLGTMAVLLAQRFEAFGTAK
jgi:hypothetical protein